MKSLLFVWQPKRGFIKFIKGVISAVCTVLFLAFLILPFCKFDGAYFPYSKYVWIIKTIQMSGSILTRPIEIPIGLTGDQIFK
jgi:hypothetical protein